LKNKKTEFLKLTKEFNDEGMLTLRLLSNRGIDSEAKASLFLYGDINNMYDSYLLKDLEESVKIIKDGIEDKKKIVIYGDYDV
ncbi:MAG: single-stranded-DNA-specific exonuclease RecJ, partial [Clostridium sp.]